MRLFKRYALDTSPQLVSAVPISQDVAATASDVENKMLEKSEKKSAVNDGTENVASVKECVDTRKESTDSSVLTRKGISTWGRKMGRRWDQIKRSDSTELLSVSRRRRRWSPHRKSYDDITDERENGNNEFPKPKRIPRVESLRNLFRTNSDRNDHFLNFKNSTRSATIQEEDTANVNHLPMEKTLSEGAIRKVPFRDVRSENFDDREFVRFDRETLLRQKKIQLSRSIQDLQEQQRILDYILKNQGMLKTQRGSTLARETLQSMRTSASTECSDDRSSTEDTKNDVSTRASYHRVGNANANDAKRYLFPHESGTLAGLEDLLSNLRLGCDESGYDSDSTRAGADSPDSEKSAIPPISKPRSLSITSDDYRVVDLSLPRIRSQGKEANIIEPIEPCSSGTYTSSEVEKIDDAIDNSATHDVFFDDSNRTQSTTLTSEEDGNNTDSCDEDTFVDFQQYQPDLRRIYSKAETDLFPKCHNGLMQMASAVPTLRNNEGLKKLQISNDTVVPTTRCDATDETDTRVKTNTDFGTKKNVSCTKAENHVGTPQSIRLQNLIKDKKSRNRKPSSPSVLNLLEHAASPCKDSPPAAKICPSSKTTANVVRYYSPKRSRSTLELDTSDDVRITAKKLLKMSPKISVKSLTRRELRTMKLTVNSATGLGISIERCEAVRPFYVIAKIDTDGEAAKSKQFRIGDEIVRVCGRRIRGMSMAEARNAIRSCVGTVELQIAREPNFTFGDEIGDIWGNALTRTRSDSDTCTMKKERIERAAFDDAFQMKAGSSCVINETTNNLQKLTGMKKFQIVRKRNADVPIVRRGSSLSMDLLTIVLEKGAPKKLGFSIVGGVDSNKGRMGIFVKDIILGGQAAEEGTLRAGDEILAINGFSLDGLTHAKALQMFKTAKAGNIVLHVARRDPTHKRYVTQSKSYDCLDKLTKSTDE